MEHDSFIKKIEKVFYPEFISKISYARNVLQSIWIRHSTISTYVMDREFVESKFSFVFYIGIVFWIIFFVSKII